MIDQLQLKAFLELDLGFLHGSDGLNFLGQFAMSVLQQVVELLDFGFLRIQLTVHLLLEGLVLRLLRLNGRLVVTMRPLLGLLEKFDRLLLVLDLLAEPLDVFILAIVAHLPLLRLSIQLHV